VPNTVEFKVDLIWKIVVIGLCTFAGRLSWKAWEDGQDTLKAMEQLIHSIDTRMSVAEFRIDSNASRINDHDSIIDDKKQ
jgi:hypothetical protein